MSTDSLFANLPDNIRDLISGTIVGNGQTLSPEAEKEIAGWIIKASDSNFVSQATLPVRYSLLLGAHDPNICRI